MFLKTLLMRMFLQADSPHPDPRSFSSPSSSPTNCFPEQSGLISVLLSFLSYSLSTEL